MDFADQNGVAGSTLTYRWYAYDVSTDTSVEIGQGQSYAFRAEMSVKSIRYTASFTDDDGYLISNCCIMVS